MKNVFKRGLYSLIPQREAEDAEDVLDRIDDDELEDEEEVAADAAASDSGRKLNVVEESDDDDDEEEVVAAAEEAVEDSASVAEGPVKPAVTLLTLEPDEVSDEVEDDADEDDEPAVADEPGEDTFEDETDDEDDADDEEPVMEQEEAPVRVTSRTRQRRRVSAPARKKQSASSEPVLPVTAPLPSSSRDEVVTVDQSHELWDQHGERVEHVAIGDISVNPNQPRRTFNPQELQDLVTSIAHHGILQPLVIRELGEGGYELIAGERRLRAAKQLGWERVPCVVRRGVGADSSRLQLALIENLQRQDLNPIEEAMAYRQLTEEYGMTHDEVGERVGRSRVSVTNTIRILQLPAEVQRGLIDGNVSAGHARAILMIPDPEKQIRFYRHVVDEGLTVRRAETRARRIQRTMNVSDPERIKKKGRHPLSLKFEGPLEDRYGYDSRIRFIEEKNRFEVTFKAHSEAEMHELIDRLLGRAELPQDVDTDIVDD